MMGAVISKESNRAGFSPPSDHATDIRLADIIALEQQGLARRAGERVGET
jgi:hypothetical protein